MATQVIDGKIVEMKFDNSEFEKNVAQSMSTLDKLKQALNFDSVKGLETVGKASKNFDMSGVGSAVDAVQAKFSALQVIGMTAISELTKAAMRFGSQVVHSVIDPIKTGGMNRAMNIEQAKFQLQGLGVAWDDIAEDINYGVKDTAYGLDVAAKAASQLTASGVQMGDEMKAALRGISGVASMTSSTYEEISPIFTTIAGQGKVMTMQLRQLESRGLNAAATLADSLGVTEAEVRKMVKDGKINFEMFAKAMDDAFGAHAKDANKTFTGAMSNVKAAMSRIGANFATPYMENMRLIYVSLIDVINGINKALEPTYELVSSIMTKVQEGITGFLENIVLKDTYTRMIEGLYVAFYALLKIIDPVRKAFKDIFPSDFVYILRDIAKSFQELSYKLVISDETAEKIRRTFRGLFAAFDIIRMAFKAAFDAIKPFTGGLGNILSNILDFSAGIGDYLVNLRNSIKVNDTFGKAFSKAADIISNAGTKIKDVLSGIVDAIKTFKANHIDNKDFSGFTDFVEAVKERLGSLELMGDLLKIFFGKIKEGLSSLAPVFESILSTLGRSLGAFMSGLGNAFKTGGGDPFSTLMSMFSTATLANGIMTFSNTLESLRQQVKNLGGLSPTLYKLKDGIRAFFITVQADVKADIILRVGKAIAVFAGALFVLSLINPVRLASSMVAVEILMNTMKDFMGFLELISRTGSFAQIGMIEVLARSMITLGTAVLVLSLAVKVMAGLDFLGLIKGLGATLVLIKALSDQAILLSNIDTKVMKGAKTMIALGIAVRILASAVKAMASLSLTELIKGLGGTVVLMYALGGAIKFMDETKLRGVAPAVLAISIALLILTKSVETLGSISFEQLAQGLAAAVIGISAMALALTLIGTYAKGGTLVGAAVAILALSAGLSVFAGVVAKFAAIQFEQLAQGVGAAVIGMLAMSGALLLLTKLSSGGELIAASLAILVMSESLNILSKAIERLGSMKIGDLIKAFVTLVAVIGGFALAASLLTSLLPVMAGLAGVVALLGVGVVALGLGVASLSFGLMTLATACTSVVANLGAILMIIAVLVPAIATALAQGIIQFVVAIGNGATMIVQAVVELGKAILNGLAELIPDLVNLIIVAGQGIIDALVALIPALVEGGINLVIGLCDGLERTIPQLIESGNRMMISFINGLAESIRRDTPLMIAAMDNLMDSLITAGKMWLTHFIDQGGDIVKKIIEGIDKLIGDVKRKGSEIIDQAKQGISDGIKSVVQLGKDFVNGFIEGIKSAPSAIAEAAKGVVDGALNAIKKTQKSNSPAKETRNLGNDFTDGYTIGMTDGKEDVQHASEDLVNSALDPMKDGAKESKTLGGTIAKGYEEIQKKAKSYFETESKGSKESKEFREEQIKRKQATDDLVKSTDAAAESTENLSTATGKATKSEKDFLSSIKDTIGNQLDIFSKFETKTEMTSKQMLENMKSNIDGMASWSKRLNDLADRGISQGLYKKLAEMGPKGYEQVNAFIQMTDEELQKANEMFATSLTLEDNQSAIVNDGFVKAGQNGVAGLNNALTAGIGEVKSTAVLIGEAGVEGVNEGFGNASPSKKTFQSGVFAYQGLNNGMKSGLTYLRSTAQALARFILNDMNEGLAPSKFYDVGKRAIEGLLNGISDSDINSQLDKKIAEIADKIRKISEMKLDEQSPSRVMMKVGKYATMGLAIGLGQAANDVYRAASNISDEAIDGLSAEGRIQDIFDNEFDLNPIITPMLDLSVVRAQMAELNSMFNSGMVGPYAGQNGGQFTANPEPTSINFTQNNYSPKELSRYDIYRNTKNQISMMKGVMRANA